jgi:hypothetical protein
MQDLRLIGVENGAILVSSEEGVEYRLPLDDALRARIAQAGSGRDPGRPGLAARLTQGRKVAPREIQAHIRSGMSAEDVAAITGAPLDYIEKFERPVLAEREHIVESALNVAVHTAADPDPLSEDSTFGSAIRSRLRGLGASDERWASWKESAGDWVVKLSFTVGQIDHDARWQYDPRRASLAPLNSEANTLSQQGDMPGSLTPRLRAVGGDERIPDASRFDSGAFDLRMPRGVAPQPSAPPARPGDPSPAVAAAAIKRAPVDPGASSQTADLLDALRRRRGERETAASWAGEERGSGHPSTGVRPVDVPLDDLDAVERELAEDAPDDRPADAPRTAAPRARTVFPQSAPAAPTRPSKKGRAAMPSWDEIVFGARSDEDPA